MAKVSRAKIKRLVEKYGGGSEAVIQVLQDIQNEYRYLPREALTYLAQYAKVPIAQIYHVATFYTAFSLKPKGEHVIQVCTGTACHVRGAPRILDQLERDLGIKAGETTDDMKFTLETVNCLGSCALGPLVVIDGKYHGHMTPKMVDKVLKQYQD